MSSDAPPPTETRASAPPARYASMPFKASASVGLGSNSLNTVNGTPACSSRGVTNRSRPACRIPLSATSSSLRAPTRFSSAGSSRMAPRPWTIRVGNDMTDGMEAPWVKFAKSRSKRLRRLPPALDDLEIPLQLPLGHRRFELAAFPLAGSHVVVDEGVAEELARLLAPRKGLGRRAQRRRERLRF